MEINVKKLRDNAVIPTRGSEYAAGYDLYAAIDETVVIGPHETQKIGTGLSFELPENTFGMIVARSGLATKEGLRPANCSGICDSDYRGEYIIALHNDSDEIRYVEPNERIAQLILMSYVPMTFSLVNELTITERGEGGFGSTGQ
jgi:dUTP pyrophosphatase